MHLCFPERNTSRSLRSFRFPLSRSVAPKRLSVPLEATFSVLFRFPLLHPGRLSRLRRKKPRLESNPIDYSSKFVLRAETLRIPLPFPCFPRFLHQRPNSLFHFHSPFRSTPAPFLVFPSYRSPAKESCLKASEISARSFESWIQGREKGGGGKSVDERHLRAAVVNEERILIRSGSNGDI